MPHISNRNFDNRFAMAQDALAAGFTTEAAKKAAIENLTTALEVACEEVKAVLLAEPHETRSEADRDLYWELPHYPHEWTAKKRAAFAPRFPALVERLDRVRALRDEIKAAPVVKGEKKPTPKQAAKLAKAMTCQCCARPIFAETGVIAHHGYERPGFGYQTASCDGARELPFEVSRDALGRHIENLKAWVVRQRAAIAAVEAEETKIAFSFDDYTDAGRFGRPVPAVRMVNRETFPAVWEETKTARRYGHGAADFDGLKARTLRQMRAALAGVVEAIPAQEERFAGWKQTHRREGEKWVAI